MGGGAFLEARSPLPQVANIPEMVSGETLGSCESQVICVCFVDLDRVQEDPWDLSEIGRRRDGDTGGAGRQECGWMLSQW